MKFDLDNFKQKNIAKLVDEQGNRSTFFHGAKIFRGAQANPTSKKLFNHFVIQRRNRGAGAEYKQRQENEGIISCGVKNMPV